MMPESANALQANAAIIEMIRLSLQVHRSSYGRGLRPDLPAITEPVIYSSRSLELGFYLSWKVALPITLPLILMSVR